MQFLQILPKLQCRVDDHDGETTWLKCTRDEACAPGAFYRIDYSEEETVRNSAATSLNLICAHPSYLGLVGSFFFIGWTTGTLLVSHMADYYGRRSPYLAGLLVRLIGVALAVHAR